MSDGKNILKLTVDHIDFNLYLKTILPLWFHAQKNVYTKKKKNITETFDFLVLFVPSDTSIRHEMQDDKRIKIRS